MKQLCVTGAPAAFPNQQKQVMGPWADLNWTNPPCPLGLQFPEVVLLNHIRLQPYQHELMLDLTVNWAFRSPQQQEINKVNTLDQMCLSLKRTDQKWQPCPNVPFWKAPSGFRILFVLSTWETRKLRTWNMYRKYDMQHTGTKLYSWDGRMGFVWFARFNSFLAIKLHIWDDTIKMTLCSIHQSGKFYPKG